MTTHSKSHIIGETNTPHENTYPYSEREKKVVVSELYTVDQNAMNGNEH